jgi:ubiquinone/menaquinone biosynthesis C-methylase UbiE
MERIPVRDRSFDLVIAHGIWNLARSAAQFRRALDEAARVAKPGAGLFVFRFSRNTLPTQTAPVAALPDDMEHIGIKEGALFPAAARLLSSNQLIEVGLEMAARRKPGARP